MAGRGGGQQGAGEPRYGTRLAGFFGEPLHASAAVAFVGMVLDLIALCLETAEKGYYAASVLCIIGNGIMLIAVLPQLERVGQNAEAASALTRYGSSPYETEAGEVLDRRSTWLMGAVGLLIVSAIVIMVGSIFTYPSLGAKHGLDVFPWAILLCGAVLSAAGLGLAAAETLLTERELCALEIIEERPPSATFRLLVTTGVSAALFVFGFCVLLAANNQAFRHKPMFYFAMTVQLVAAVLFECAIGAFLVVRWLEKFPQGRGTGATGDDPLPSPRAKALAMSRPAMMMGGGGNQFYSERAHLRGGYYSYGAV